MREMDRADSGGITHPPDASKTSNMSHANRTLPPDPPTHVSSVPCDSRKVIQLAKRRVGTQDLSPDPHDRQRLRHRLQNRVCPRSSQRLRRGKLTAPRRQHPLRFDRLAFVPSDRDAVQSNSATYIPIRLSTSSARPVGTSYNLRSSPHVLSQPSTIGITTIHNSVRRQSKPPEPGSTSNFPGACSGTAKMTPTPSASSIDEVWNAIPVSPGIANVFSAP